MKLIKKLLKKKPPTDKELVEYSLEKYANTYKWLEQHDRGIAVPPDRMDRSEIVRKLVQPV